MFKDNLYYLLSFVKIKQQKIQLNISIKLSIKLENLKTLK